jgi:8-oxo-dGTP pyrophosphatase MutT (NUDIX family)
MEKEVYKGNIIRVTEEKIGAINWERVHLPDGVIIYPVNEQGQVLMIEEKRPHEDPPVRIKAVSGILEYDKGTPEENAQRELQEEVGFRAGSLERLMVMKGTGTVSNTQYYFIARDLTPSKLPNPDGEDTIIGYRFYEPGELLRMFMADEIKWSMSTLGFLRLYHSLQK